MRKVPRTQALITRRRSSLACRSISKEGNETEVPFSNIIKPPALPTALNPARRQHLAGCLVTTATTGLMKTFFNRRIFVEIFFKFDLRAATASDTSARYAAERHEPIFLVKSGLVVRSWFCTAD